MHKHTEQLRLLRKTIGANIHKYRSQRKMTLRRFARLVNIKAEVIDQCEIGKNDPSYELLAKSATVLNVSIFELVKPPES